MKTAIRIQQHQDNGYNHMTFQILDMTFAGTISSIGHISFQQSAGEGENHWYGLTYNVKTSKEGDLLKMAKLAKLINKSSSWNAQPDEIKKIIGAEEYVVYNHDFYPVSANGQNLYNLMMNGQLYSRVYARDDKEAQKKAKKKHTTEAIQVEFNQVINF